MEKNRKKRKRKRKKKSLFRFSPYCPNHVLSFKYSTPHCLFLWIRFTYNLSVSHSLSVCCRLLYTLNINHRHNNNSTKPEPKADHRIHNPLELLSLRFLRSHTLSLSLSSLIRSTSSSLYISDYSVLIDISSSSSSSSSL